MFYDGKELSPVQRADYFFEKYKNAEPEERKILMKEKIVSESWLKSFRNKII